MDAQKQPQTFADKVLAWYDQHGRKSLPWQQERTAYKVWISEIMLQQTQVNTVIPYFERFMQHFPNVLALANAKQDDVLALWSGLGYYARARNLHKAAIMVRDEYQGDFPETLETLQTLPGIGRSTAGAILSLACDQAQAILDGNVKRVLARYHTVEGWSGKSAVLKTLWAYAEQHLPQQHNAAYTQAMMDLGALICTRRSPQCSLCPLHHTCRAYISGMPEQWPFPKPKKTLPERQAYLLMLHNQEQAVFLQKRPPVGIWGGLWSLPQFETYSCAKNWLLENFQADLEHATEYARFSHTFSHFRLHIRALQLEVSIHPQNIREMGEICWHHSDDELPGGFAAPVSKLLRVSAI